MRPEINRVLSRTLPRRLPWLIGLLITFAPIVAHAQPWSGILSPSRATDWSTAGATIPPRTTVCATIAPYSGTAAAINSAIAACPSGQVVQLGAGTFNLSSGIVFAKSNVTLRGQGAASTKLVVSGTTSGCSLFYASALRMCAGTGNIGTTDGGGPGPDRSANWTAGYAKGTSVITLSSTTGLAVGSTIFLDQLNDTSDGWPAPGDLYLCDGTSNHCSNQGGNSFARSNRVQTEVHMVTNISGTNVTIDPPLHAPNFRAGQSPGAWWGNSSVVLQNSGVEDFTLDFTGGGNIGILLVNATNDWVKGVRLIQSGGPGSFVFHVGLVNAFRVSVRDNYFYGPNVQGNTQYAYTPHVSGSLLLENNIFHHNVSAMIPNDPEVGSVYAFNYVDDVFYSGAVQLHSAASMLNLYEGNNLPSYLGDILHGPHFMETLFRNHIDGFTHNQTQVNENTAIVLLTQNRFFNLVGNVIGHSHFTTYESLQSANQNAIYGFGSQGSGSGTAVGNDPNVQRTVMRWGNWDSVSNATRFVASEVPSGIANFANPVPASQNLPPSFYLSAQPPWWTTAFGTPPWPAVGPNVTGGNISNSTTGGHANKIPARLCFENTPVDPAYASSNPRIRLYDARTCYAQSAGPNAPSNLIVR